MNLNCKAENLSANAETTKKQRIPVILNLFKLRLHFSC